MPATRRPLLSDETGRRRLVAHVKTSVLARPFGDLEAAPIRAVGASVLVDAVPVEVANGTHPVAARADALEPTPLYLLEEGDPAVVGLAVESPARLHGGGTVSSLVVGHELRVCAGVGHPLLFYRPPAGPSTSHSHRHVRVSGGRGTITLIAGIAASTSVLVAVVIADTSCQSRCAL